MSIRTILAVLSGTQIDKRVLNAALDVGQSSEARITGLYDETALRDFPGVYAAYGTGMYLSDELSPSVERQIAEKRLAARRHFDEWQVRTCVPHPGPNVTGPTALFRSETDCAPVLLSKYGPTADLIVVGLPTRGEIDNGLTLEAALFHTGRPVLALPSTGPTTIPQGAPIAVAWNGRPEAARALSAALPILARSDAEVILMHVGAGERPQTLASVVDYLALHGIESRSLYLTDRPGGTGALLLEEAARHDAGLLVMGAYSHNRWREMILGGVTRHVIQHAVLPVLFAH